METMDIPAGSGRRLAALYHPPTGADRGRGVLILNPLGQEAVRARMPCTSSTAGWITACCWSC